MKYHHNEDELRTGESWFDPRVSQFLFPDCERIQSSLFAVHCFDDTNIGKQPMAWVEYCDEYWLKGLQESMDMCAGRRDITERMLKTA